MGTIIIAKRGSDRASNREAAARCLEQPELTAMLHAARAWPSSAVEALMYGNDYAEHPKSSVQKAAKKA